MPKYSLTTIATAAAVILAVMWARTPNPEKWALKPQPAGKDNHPACPDGTDSVAIFFGATSMLGRYIVSTWREKSPKTCVVSYARSRCADCHVNIKGDLRDTMHVERVFQSYNADMVLTAVKPPLLGITYDVYLTLNFYSMAELVRIAKESGVKRFLHVSSIAASSHYVHHHMSTETTPQPKLTEYKAPYDVSKRLGEEVVLRAHSDEFTTVSIRVSGIIGGDGDPYDVYRMPFIPSFSCPHVIDSNFAGNIADALHVVDETMKSTPSVGGQFYYYTGEHLSESDVADLIGEARGKPVIRLPFAILETIIKVWSWARVDHTVYSNLDLMKMAVIEQTFDQSKFFSTFHFTPSYTVREAVMKLYKK